VPSEGRSLTNEFKNKPITTIPKIASLDTITLAVVVNGNYVAVANGCYHHTALKKNIRQNPPDTCGGSAQVARQNPCIRSFIGSGSAKKGA
jgi:hypothetical protein